MMKVLQISSMEKVRGNEFPVCDEICKKTVLKGERFSYQIVLQSDEWLNGTIEVVSDFGDAVRVFYVLNAVMDNPVTDPSAEADDDYITKEPGLMPDILQPIAERNNIWMTGMHTKSLWVEVNVPKEMPAGVHPVTIRYQDIETGELIVEKTVEFTVLNHEILPQSLIYTRWFYVDCIADYHRVEVYSEEHWALIEAYIRQAVDVGINMILVPVHTPPLDTAIGTTRTCVQLVDVEKEGKRYTFEFSKLRRYIEICKRCGIQYFEIAHMFSQWGAKCAPNIMVTENGKKSYLFGWDVAADSAEYVSFLKQYIATISIVLEEQGISENTYFHISDEPTAESLETYQRAYNIIKPLIGKSKTLDALSDFTFYEKGLVECPVTCVEHMKTFLPHKIENQWTYYCCGPQHTYTNSFLAMPLQRVRIIGVLLYKYDVKGFLHWGLNFYNGQVSRYPVNPYQTTSSDGRFPSGDPFILYPSEDGAYGCMRGKVMYEAIEDMNLCRTLEQCIGREAVCKLIDEEAGMDVTFENYPRNREYLLNLRDKMIALLEQNI